MRAPSKAKVSLPASAVFLAADQVNQAAVTSSPSHLCKSLKIMIKNLLIALGTAASLVLLASQAHAGSFWALTSNGGGKSQSACHVTNTSWFVTGCNSKSVSSPQKGAGKIGFVSFATKKPEQVSDTQGFANTSATDAVSGCKTFNLNGSQAVCESGAASGYSPYFSGGGTKRTIKLIAW